MSSDYDFDLLCIGSGPGGQRAAVQGAKLRKRVAIIHDRPIVGGACVHTGTIPSKTFRQAVLALIGLPQQMGGRRPARPTAGHATAPRAVKARHVGTTDAEAAAATAMWG